MVAAAAFLIILVIIFGLENVRNFIFGTFGVLAWVVIGIMVLAGIGYLSEWCKDMKKSEREQKAKRKEEAAKEKAERSRIKARDAKLKVENPAQYKKDHAADHLALRLYGGGLLIAIILSIIGIILYLVQK